MTEEYTPGYAQTASNFMAQRTAASHAGFVLPRLRPNHRLLDCGCGPGSISCDFAQILISGHVYGIDREESQIELARDRASQHALSNVTFDVASIYKLPFDDSSFDVVFAHAIFEHISTPDAAIVEMLRVLKPGGIAAIRSPDWGGFLVGPDVPGLQDAIRSYAELQTANGGDIHIGRKLPSLLRNAGFEKIEFSATYECYQSPTRIYEYLSLKLNDNNAKAMRRWSDDPDAFFAQAWCEAVGTKCG
jgi:SAM-dependent methyltransferase